VNLVRIFIQKIDIINFEAKKKVMIENLRKENDDLKKLKSDNDTFLKLKPKNPTFFKSIIEHKSHWIKNREQEIIDLSTKHKLNAKDMIFSLRYFMLEPNSDYVKKSFDKHDQNILKKVQKIVSKRLTEYQLLIDSKITIRGNNEIIKKKILFDFFLSFKELDLKTWNNVYHKIKLDKKSIGVWHDDETRKLLSFSKKYNSDMENSLTQQNISKELKNSVN